MKNWLLTYARALGFSLLLIPLNYSLGAQSVLSSGNWYKFSVPQSGIYKLDQSFFQNLGLNPASLDPTMIQVYGQSGGMLPQSNQTSRSQDLIQNALFAHGLEDGSFDNGDYFLMHAQGPDLLQIEPSGSFSYHKNLYSDQSFYFLTIGTQAGKRMNTTSDLGGSFPEVNHYRGIQAHEIDQENLLSSGREWYGEDMISGGSLSVEMQPLPELTSSGQIQLVVAAINRDDESAQIQIGLNSSSLGAIDIDAIDTDIYDPRGVSVTDTLYMDQSAFIASTDLSLQLDYEAGSGGRGNLNYVVLTYEATLKFDAGSLQFSAPQSQLQSQSTYRLHTDLTEINIWDITNPQDITIQEFQREGMDVVFGAASSQLRTYIAWEGDDFPAPTVVGSVANQDLAGLSVPDLLIISHPQWRDQADRLANFRREHDQLSVEVVTPEEIYHEFSSGRQDVTAIRDFIRHLYIKDNRLSYILLFGRGSYDFKDRVDGNTNFVPTYESRNSLHPIYSHNSDDFFTFMDSDEGEWTEELSGIGGHLMDLSIGRLPVITQEQARDVVDKLIHYATNPTSLGSWRQDIYYVADDGDFNLHQRDADQLANLVDTANQDFNVNKIYLDAFPQEQTPNGESAESVNQQIDQAVKKGALIINYTGHGSEFRWAEETILNQNMIDSWENYDRLPFFVTATCEFGRHDDPDRISGAEKLVTSNTGGAIGLVTTARPVFASKNFLLNRAFYQIALDPVANNYPTLGDIFKFVKNDSYRVVANRNFVLLGDPSMRLAYPQYNLVITEIEKNLGVPTDTVEALSRVRIAGKVINAAGDTINTYTGTAEVTVFDKVTDTQTLGSDGGPTFRYKQRNSVLFRGLASIAQGSFEVEFVVPKNINYQVDQGKISLYGVNSDGSSDAGGATISLVIGGSNPQAPADNTPPEIQLFMDDLSFRDGGATATNTTLLAQLSDENGINISNTGFGQDITLSLNNGAEVILNDFYRANLDDFTSGWVNYPLTELESGSYELKIKAWDVYNNSKEATLDFVVVENPALALHRVINYPNPFQELTTFQIDHNQAGSPLEVGIFIYNGKGQLVRTINKQYTVSPTSINDLTWRGDNNFGADLKSGLYLYKVIVKSLINGEKSEEFRKLVLIK